MCVSLLRLVEMLVLTRVDARRRHWDVSHLPNGLLLPRRRVRAVYAMSLRRLCLRQLTQPHTDASSALSAMSFVRNCVGAVFPLFTQNMYDRLGIQGATGLTAGLGTLLSVTPFILFIYGARLRARSPFAKELARREAEERAKREGQTRRSAEGSPCRSAEKTLDRKEAV